MPKPSLPKDVLSAPRDTSVSYRWPKAMVAAYRARADSERLADSVWLMRAVWESLNKHQPAKKEEREEEDD